ncbi:MAG: SurA N-terminal domain-containing protein [Schleiferiaceae bacterium]|nr:SurA N-terminal domain-containing protein [Schleiferiaceae bacterium]
MATLERIRKRSGLLLIVIGLAMLAFILTDLFSSGNSMFRSNQTEVGSVNGHAIQYQDFSERVDEVMATLQAQAQNNPQMQTPSRTQAANRVWNEFLQEELLHRRFQEIGVQVSNEEISESIKQNPQIQNQPNFKDQVTGQFSPSLFRQYVRNLREQASSDPQARRMYRQWVNFEKNVYEQTLENKYQDMVTKGFYYPTKLAEGLYIRRQVNATARYFGLTYNSIADSAVSYDDGDLRAYYEDHKNAYRSEALRDLAYVTFRVDPSASDSLAIRKELQTYMQEEVVSARGQTDTFPAFQNASNDSLFAVGRSDYPVGARYLTTEQMGAPLDTLVPQMDTGEVYGPYVSEGTYTLTKVSDKTTVPDSVKARHILISFQGANQGQSQSQRAPKDAQKLADSLFTAFQEDTTGFAQAAQELSDDPGSKVKGGALGWFTRERMVAPFSRFAFLNETGDVGLVFSRFGFHVIHIQDQAGSNDAWRLVNIKRDIEPGEATRDSVYEEATRFASQASGDLPFAEVAQKGGYNARPVTAVEPSQEQLLGIGSNREIVRWAFEEETKTNDVELFSQERTAYIVATLTAAYEEGYKSLDQVREQVATEVIKEKKAAALQEKLENAAPEGDNIQQWAAGVDKGVESQNITFATSNLSGYGTEPLPLGAATGLPLNVTSPVLEGDRGVYLMRVARRGDAEGLNNYEAEQQRLATEMENVASQQILSSLKEAARIEDNRVRFY